MSVKKFPVGRQHLEVEGHFIIDPTLAAYPGNSKAVATVGRMTVLKPGSRVASATAVVEEFEEVVEFYRMSGDVDYLMRVVVPDIAAYDRFYRRLIERVRIADVSSSFAMERLKYTTALPLDYA